MCNEDYSKVNKQPVFLFWNTTPPLPTPQPDTDASACKASPQFPLSIGLKALSTFSTHHNIALFLKEDIDIFDLCTKVSFSNFQRHNFITF